MAGTPPPTKPVADTRALVFLLAIFAMLGIIFARLTYVQVVKPSDLAQRASPTLTRAAAPAAAPSSVGRGAAPPQRTQLGLASRIWRKVKHLFRRLRNAKITTSHDVSPRA